MWEKKDEKKDEGLVPATLRRWPSQPSISKSGEYD